MVNVAEEWREVPGYEHHEVSSFGRVRSKERTQSFTCRWGHEVSRRHAAVMFDPYVNAYGYRVTRLRKNDKQWGVHQLVALAFIGPCPSGLCVNHINGDKFDNRPENLEYVTPEENVSHAHRIGLNNAKGENHNNASMSDEDATQVIAALNQGMSTGEVAKRFGVSRGVAEKIRRGDCWAHLGSVNYVKRRHKKVSDEMKERILELLSNGATQSEVVRTTGVPQATVSRLMRSNARLAS